MAEDKNAVLVYADWLDKFEELTDDEAGRLIKHFFRYINDQNPEAPDRTTKLCFMDIEKSLKRDLKKWEQRAERSRENGKKGGRPPKEYAEEKPKETQQVILEPTKPDSVSVTVSVSDSVITPTEIISIEVAVSECLKDENWKAEVERIYKVDRHKIQFALAEFKSHCITTKEDKPRSLKKFCQHFTNWVRVKKQYQLKNTG